MDGTNPDGRGEDCTAIPGVNVTTCVKGKCKIGQFEWDDLNYVLIIRFDSELPSWSASQP